MDAHLTRVGVENDTKMIMDETVTASFFKRKPNEKKSALSNIIDWIERKENQYFFTYIKRRTTRR